MSDAFSVRIEGIGIWAGPWRDWGAARDALCGNVEFDGATASKPAPALLAATERRRAPESVLLAIEVAQQACGMAQRDARELPHVFACAYGDLSINDYLCATLARAPLEVSPIKFHNSVHNAPAGYWSIATGCRASSSAISAGHATFATGMLEAALLAHCESRPVLLVAYDVAAIGALCDVIDCDAPFAVAFVLAPAAPALSGLGDLRIALRADALAPEADVLHAWCGNNPAARSLALLKALARRQHTALNSRITPATTLVMETAF
jgi:hypothetical protein